MSVANSESWVISGTVLKIDEISPFTTPDGLSVQIFKDGNPNSLSNSGIDDSNGNFSITLNKQQFLSPPDLIIKVFDTQSRVLYTSNTFSPSVSEDNYSVGDLKVTTMPIPTTWRIHGIAYHQDGTTPFTQGTILAYGEQNGVYNLWLGQDGLINSDFTITISRDTFQQGNVEIEAPKIIIEIRDNAYNAIWRSDPFTVPYSEYYIYPIVGNPDSIGNATVPNIPPVAEDWSVHGTVFENGQPPSRSLTVEAFDTLYRDGNRVETPLGTAFLGNDGAYLINYSKSAFQNGDFGRIAPNLLVKVLSGGTVVKPSGIFYQASNNTEINISFCSDGEEPIVVPDMPGNWSVYGQVVNRKNLPLKGRSIKAYALEFTEESGFNSINLGLGVTGNDGIYNISYNPSQLPSTEKAAIYAEMTCYSNDITSPLVFGAAKHQVFNFVYDDDASNVFVDEYNKMDAKLCKYLYSILNTSAILPAQNTDRDEKKISCFLKHPAYLQFTALLEAKEARYTDCYFRANLIACELQERFNVAQGDQTGDEFDKKYNSTSYVPFFYALLRTGIVSSSAELLKLDSAQLLNHLLGAVSEQIIAADLDVKGFLDLWYEIFRTQAGEVPSVEEWTIYHILLLALQNSLEAPEEPAIKNLVANLLGKYYEAGSDARLFLESVLPVDSTSLLNEEQWKNIEFLLDLGDFCENYRDIIQASFLHCVTHSITSLEGMLTLSEEDWKTIVADSSGLYVTRNTPTDPDSKLLPPEQGTLPPEFIGANGDEQQAIYARKLQNGLLAWFPQTELAVNMGQEIADLNSTLASDKQLDVDKWNAVSVFLADTNKPPFDLGSTNLGVYLDENRDNEYFEEHPDKAAILTDNDIQQKVRQLQRLFRLTEDLPSIFYLVSKGIESSYQITQMTEDKFLAKFSVGLGGMNKARQIHRLAVNYTMNASLQVSQYHSGLAMQGEPIPAIQRGPTANGPAAMENSASTSNSNVAPLRVSTKVIANWKTLFGTINRNAAIKGQSLLSPSAYLVDLLEFLKDGDGYKLLIKRRPDILNLKLSKENAEVSLPMIDLAIELLEKLAIQDSLGTLNKQTLEEQRTWSSEDLRAQPEYEPDPRAAKLLQKALYPLTLPTNFSREEARLILGKLGLSWRDLALAFQPASDSGYQRRYLVTDGNLDKALLLPDGNNDSNLFPVWELWGLQEDDNDLLRPDKSTPETGSWNTILSVASIFLDRSGLTLEKLQDLLTLPMFKDYKVKIKATAQAIQLGDIGGYWIEDIDADFARKINCFVRLQHLLGWTPEEIDAAWGFSLDELDQVQDLSKTLKVPVMQVIFWHREMTHDMFKQIFQPFQQDSAEELIEIDDFANWANRYLGISQADMNLLLKHFQVEHSPETETLTYSQAKQIYRLNSFAKAVKLSIGDFIDLTKWFSLLESTEAWDLNECQQFYAFTQELQINPLPYASIKQLAFAPDKALLEKGTTFMQKLGEALDAIRKAHEIPEVSNKNYQNDLQDAMNDLQDAIIACLAVFEIDETEMVILIQSTDDNEDILRGWLKSLFDREVIEDVAINNVLESQTINGRLETLLSSLNSTVQKRCTLAIETEIFAQVASHFALTEEIARRLLQDNIHNAWLHSVNDSDAEDTGKDALKDWMAVTEANFTEENEISLGVYMRLAKAAILVSSLKLNTVEQLDAWMPKEVDDTLPDWNSFPKEENEESIDWNKFHPLLQVMKVLKDLDFQKEGYEKLVASNDDLRLEKWNLRKSDLDALLIECGLKINDGEGDDDKDINATPEDWVRFSQLLALFRKSYNLPAVLKNVLMTVPVSANDENYVSDYIESVATLRKNISRSMSVTGWREWIQPVSDGLRIRKRDALAAYVCWCSQQPEKEIIEYYPTVFIDTNDIYAYYLTDVEMEPDMSTSRIRQALNSVQQFVQRAQLGLEGRFTLTDDQKSYWEWMKNYRVWEANRKVFLYAENWIEAELRDDKTPFFKELEDKLMESTDNPNAMEEALSEYLEKMLDVGSLQILGACKEDGGNGNALYTLHIVGRTRGEPGTYYYRRYLAKALHSGEWTPWDRIDTEIQAKSLSMAIMNGNLYLFWPTIQHTEEEAEGYEGDTVLGENSTKSILELRLNWTCFNGKKWSGKKTTKSMLNHVLYDNYGHKLEVGESYEDRFHFRAMNNSSDFLQVKVYRTWYDYDKLETKTLKTRVMEDTQIEKQAPVYQPTEYQMIEEFGEFQLWKDGRDVSSYYGGNWSRKTTSNYANFYPPANCSLVHNYWKDDGEQESDDDVQSVNTEDSQEREPKSQQKRRYGLVGNLRFKKLWIQRRLQYLSWMKLKKKHKEDLIEDLIEDLTEDLTIENARERISELVDPSEAGKLVYPKKNIILNKIDGQYMLYPVNFSFYTGEKLPFFFMGEDKTYLIEEVARAGGAVAGGGQKAYRFNQISHPLVNEFHKRYRSGGREWLYTRETEALPMAEGYYRSYSYYNYYFSVYLGYSIAGDWEAWDLSQSLFDYRHQPTNGAVTRPFPSPVVDFTWGSSNGIYNWELFFHVPMLIASKLTQEQRYEEAMDWMHMVFDPRMDLSVYERTKRWAQALPKGSRFWRFLPFFANKDADANILETLGMPSERDKTPERDALEALIDKWKRDPFNPHLIARARPAAYQKYVVMKYLDNLIAWADQLFTTDTMESLNEAIQLYMLAADILGPKEAATTEVDVKPLNVQTLMSTKLVTLKNIMISIEDDLIRVNDREKTIPQSKLSAEAGQLVGISGDMFYFGVPRNDKLQAYWATVADRLYKIRNSLNIDGVKRTLALYEPPIDPAMLVRARAMGLDISSALSAMNAPTPLYRFQVMLQKAMDIAREVQSIGAALLSALEKKDGESLSLLRAEQEREMLTLNKSIRKLQIDEANVNLESLLKNRESTEIRYNFYKNIEKYSSKEDLAMTLTKVADGIQYASAGAHLAASIVAAFPDTHFGGVVNAFGGPQFAVSTGGGHLSEVAICVASALQLTSQICRSEASMALTQAGYERRWDEWKLQEKLAKTELDNLDKQILASEIRIHVAEKEMENLEHQIEQSDEIYEFMTSRFTSRELYTWMATQLGNLYKNTFQQALKAAQRAECCYKFELGIIESIPPFIKLDYWDGLHQGLLAGERLLYDLRLMESSFLEKNKRELEITRPVSLMQLNPVALRKLQENGECVFKVPEVLFDMDFPGQYFRRIQSVRLEIHCATGPNVSVSAKLSLLNNSLRKSDTLATKYDHQDNYLDNRIGIRSIATSQAQNDSGVFDLNFKDERYLPFEGAGAISEWRLELPAKYRQFDYQSISDVVLHISYTARDSGGLLKQAAIDSIAHMWSTYKTLSGEGLVQEIHLSRDYSDVLQQLRAGAQASLQIGPKDFPAFTQGGDCTIQSIRIFAKARNRNNDEFNLNLKFQLVDKNEKNLPSESELEPFINIHGLLDTDQWKELSSTQVTIIGKPKKLCTHEWILDVSNNEQLNDLGDIMIEYRYSIEGET